MKALVSVPFGGTIALPLAAAEAPWCGPGVGLDGVAVPTGAAARQIIREPPADTKLASNHTCIALGLWCLGLGRSGCHTSCRSIPVRLPCGSSRARAAFANQVKIPRLGCAQQSIQVRRPKRRIRRSIPAQDVGAYEISASNTARRWRRSSGISSKASEARMIVPSSNCAPSSFSAHSLNFPLPFGALGSARN